MKCDIRSEYRILRDEHWSTFETNDYGKGWLSAKTSKYLPLECGPKVNFQVNGNLYATKHTITDFHFLHFA